MGREVRVTIWEDEKTGTMRATSSVFDPDSSNLKDPGDVLMELDSIRPWPPSTYYGLEELATAIRFFMMAVEAVIISGAPADLDLAGLHVKTRQFLFEEETDT